jgi:hypothetical protein
MLVVGRKYHARGTRSDTPRYELQICCSSPRWMQLQYRVPVAIADALIEHLRATYRTDIAALTKSFTSRSSATTNAYGLHAGMR